MPAIPLHRRIGDASNNLSKHAHDGMGKQAGLRRFIITTAAAAAAAAEKCNRAVEEGGRTAYLGLAARTPTRAPSTP
jgi:hypothetical protein